MKAAQLQKTLEVFGKGMAQVLGVIASTDYACANREWFGQFGPALKTDLERLGVSKYVPARNDCTDFSLYAMALARLSHNISTSNKTALAFGTVDYLRELPNAIPEGHRINIAVVLESGIYTPIFFEPQLQKIVTLSETEQESIRAYYI